MATAKTVLLVGSGGREHAIAWKLAQSPQVGKLILLPGNDGIQVAEGDSLQLVRWNEKLPKGPEAKPAFDLLAKRAKEEGVDLAIVAPDDPLADGMADSFREAGIKAFGPTKAAAQIEASKEFAKKIMKAAGVPTAEYEVFDDIEKAKLFLEDKEWQADTPSWVLKADGLALGKGVEVCSSKDQALEALSRLFPISKRILIEEFLDGEELSWMGFCDGKNVALFEPARDYKRLLNDQKGPNTGGMGAYCPVSEVDQDQYYQEVREKIFQPTLKAMEAGGCPFQGLLYAGIMRNSKGELFVLEFNARFGDPEAQVLLNQMDGDLYDWCERVADGNLDSSLTQVPHRDGFSVIVVGASPGYPQAPEKGLLINGPVGDISLCEKDPRYFFAGVKKQDETFLTSGGRVLGAIGTGKSLKDARNQAFQRIKELGFDKMHYRTDIADG